METKKMKALALVEDNNYYPRHGVDTQRIGYLVDLLKCGKKVPPIRVWKGRNIIIEGRHRVRAAILFEGDGAEVECELKSYRNDLEAMRDAVELNLNHGLPLTTHDRLRSALMLADYGMKRDEIAAFLNIPQMKYDALMGRRKAFCRAGSADIAHQPATKQATDKAGNIVLLKRTVEHMAGKTLSRNQVEANNALGGMRPTFTVNQLIILIDNGMIDKSNEQLHERLEVLSKLLAHLLRDW